MNRSIVFPRAGVFAVLTSIVAAHLTGQTFSVLVNCDTASASPAAPLTLGRDGNFYGTTSAGRTYGTIFRMTSGGSLTTLHALTASEGSSPTGGVIFASDGYLYGTTNQGGTNSDGTIFKVSTSGAFTKLHDFSGTSDGAQPVGKLVQASDGNLYGVTNLGGANSCGSIFQITTSGTLTDFHDFNCSIDGGNPKDGLIQATDGNLYGTTSGRGAAGSGTVFRIGLDGTFNVIHSFGSTEGGSPYAALIQASDGNFYGTTHQGGSGGFGTVFKLTSNGVLTTLHSFTGTDGKNPSAPVTEGSDGNLYGTAYGGGDAIYGAMFVVTPSGQFTRLHSFTGSGGQYPEAALVENPAGTFIGTASLGGLNNKGVVYSLQYTAPPIPGPSINTSGVVPVFGTSPVVQSGEWVSIYGSNLASKAATWNGDFPVSLGGTSVTIGGKPAYLWYVNPTQINLQVSDDLPLGSTSAVVTTASGSSSSTVTIAQASPSFSLLDSKHIAGIILRSDGSGLYGGGSYDILGPTGSSLGYATVAATAGDTVELFGVGFGPTNPAVPAGQPFSGAAAVVNAPTLRINGVVVTPAFTGLSSAGLYQINLTIPSGLPTGDVPIQAIVNGATTQQSVVISLY